MLRPMRAGALLAGAVALCVMAGAVISDWVFEDGHLPSYGVAFFAIGGALWIAALLLVIAGRAAPILLAAALSPVVLAISWQLLDA
jgi:hypothetical protein